MVREIIKDTEFLSHKCEKSTDIRKAREIAKDLIDTALHNNENNEKKCCGLAANQIGEQTCVIVAQMPNGSFDVFINPVIVDHSHEMIESTEGCMSFDEERTVQRYKGVTIMAQNRAGQYHRRSFGGFTALIIQHEIDHLRGILI